MSSTPILNTTQIDTQINELQKKIKIEEKVKNAAEQMRSHLKDKNAIQEIEIQCRESMERLGFLEGEMYKLLLKRDGGLNKEGSGLGEKEGVNKEGSGLVVGEGESGGMKEEEGDVKPLPTIGKSGLGVRQGSIISNSGVSTTSSSFENFGKMFQKSSSGFLSKLGFNKGFNQSSQSINSITPDTTSNTTNNTNNSNTTPYSQQSRKQSIFLDINSNTNNTNNTQNRLLNPEKIQQKLQELQSKLETEQKLKLGSERLLTHFKDEKQRSMVEKQYRDSKQRLSLLKNAYQRYSSMYVEGLAESTPGDENNKERKSVTGKLKIGIHQAKNLLGKRHLKNEYFVEVRVDQTKVYQTRARSKCVWNEWREIVLDKNVEIEFCVCDVKDGVLGLVFFKLADLEREMSLLQKQDSADSTTTNTSGSNSDGILTKWDIEPSGLLDLTLKFKSESLKKQSSKVQRRRAVKKKKIVMRMGHKFVPLSGYTFLRCAICGEYSMIGFYQCEQCQYLCHKKCLERLFLKCISRTDDTIPTDNNNQNTMDILKHNVPHKMIQNREYGMQWCHHCGFLCGLGKKSEKCQCCEVVCHESCRVYLPNFCGLSVDKAFLMMTELRRQSKPSISTVGVGGKTKSREQLPVSQTQSQISGGLEKKVKLEDFTFLSVLGKGNFGKVMLAEEKQTGKLWAIKVLKKEFILQNDEMESIRSEKRVFQAINRGRHPFLVALHSCFQTDSRIYFIMEYISGGDLMLHIQRQQFSEKRARFYASEVLLALKYFHDQGIVYRDLKLDNILLGLDGHIKLADYGLCKEQMGYGQRTLTFCGTPEFMAPEILMERAYGREVDWWALGVLVYEMNLGQAPFKGGDEDEIFESIIEDEVLYPHTMSRDAVSLLEGLLEKDPERRLGSGEGDAKDVMGHVYFKGIDWQALLEKRIRPPFVPEVKGERDVSNFDEEFTREVPQLTPINNELSAVDQEEFSGFSYVAEFVGRRDEDKRGEEVLENPFLSQKRMVGVLGEQSGSKEGVNESGLDLTAGGEQGGAGGTAASEPVLGATGAAGSGHDLNATEDSAAEDGAVEKQGMYGTPRMGQSVESYLVNGLGSIQSVVDTTANTTTIGQTTANTATNSTTAGQTTTTADTTTMTERQPVMFYPTHSPFTQSIESYYHHHPNSTSHLVEGRTRGSSESSGDILMEDHTAANTTTKKEDNTTDNNKKEEVKSDSNGNKTEVERVTESLSSAQV